jgi:hypothetical protein
MIWTPLHRRSHGVLASMVSAMALLLLLSPLARASPGTQILADCGGGRIPTGFTQQDYKSALKKMSPFLTEYTNCEELIHRAQLAAVGGNQRGSGGQAGLAGSGGSGSPAATVAPPTPTEQRALEHAHSSGARPVQVGNQVINPGVVHASIASAVSSLPTPLLAVLAFLLTCVLLVSGWALRRYVSARHSS